MGTAVRPRTKARAKVFRKLQIELHPAEKALREVVGGYNQRFNEIPFGVLSRARDTAVKLGLVVACTMCRGKGYNEKKGKPCSRCKREPNYEDIVCKKCGGSGYLKASDIAVATISGGFGATPNVTE